MRVTSWVFFLIGLGFLAVSFYILSQKISFWYTAQPATATVVAFEAQTGEDDYSELLHPVVRFNTAQGDSVRVIGPAGTMLPTFQLGQQLPLRYNPAYPRQVEFPDFLSRWGSILISAVLSGMGAIVLCVGLEFKLDNTRLV